MESTAAGHDELDYVGGGLPKTTNWWGAFVIGLAGTILVTGIAPVMVTSLGAAAIPSIFIITVSGYLLCLFLAELSAMMPDRSGGSPAYAYPAFKDRWPRFAEHINGFTAWAYWLGWFPVGPLNMILASFYIVNRFSLSTAGFTPIHTQIAWWTLVISIGGLLLLLIPAIRGLRFGTVFATTLAMLSMIPLTFLTIYIAFAFLLTWNVIAMEAAACYIGETRNPDRDAKIAMNLEGAYGVFIYTLIPIAFVIVIGTKALGNVALADPKTIFVNFASKVFGAGAGSNVLNWLIAIMLILALILSALNAITGTARSLHQMSMDGQFPKFFQHTNHHGVPDRSMMFNIVCMIIVVFFGGAVEIYTFSNVGYLASFVPVLVGYYLLRKDRPNVRRPFKLPEWMKYLALALAAFYTFIYFYGGITYAQCACSQAGHSTLPYYFAGFAVLAAYLPLYWWRKRDDVKTGAAAPMTIGQQAAAAAGSGGAP
jgi:amino acid transporter